MSEARKKILTMLAEGKITVEQSEELLKAVDADQQTAQQDSGPKRSFGSNVSNMAHQFQNQVREAVKNIEPQTRDIKNRLKELGGWVNETVGSMMKDFSFDRHGPVDGMDVHFTVPAPDGVDQCKIFDINNPYGSVQIKEGPQFTLEVQGKISRAELGNEFPLNWFLNNILAVRGNTLALGMEKPNAFKAVFHLNITLPASAQVRLKSLSGAVMAKGAFELESSVSISGDMVFSGVRMREASLDTVSGNIEIDGTDIDSMNVRLTSNNLVIRGGKIRLLTVQNISGNVLIEDPQVADKTKIELLTTTGHVTLKKFQGPICRVEANSRTGDLTLEWEMPNRKCGSHEAVMESNEAGATLKIESTSGDIQLLK